MVIRLLGYVLIIGALVLAASVIYRDSRKAQVPVVFSSTQMLESTWLAYKTNYVENGTYRTLDKQRDNVTTSEGQSYTMMRAVWMGDKETFDGAWKWTKENIYHADDHLFAWLWGKLPNGKYGVLTAQSGENTASDADENIALSLVFAYARWQDPAYLQSARSIINDIWDKEVIEINGVPYLAADNIEKTSLSQTAAINPSYLEPAAYKIFARIDPSHPWDSLANSSYSLLQKSMQQTLGSATSAGLPPNWISINKTTGALTPLVSATTDTNFGFDAMRVPFNLALDWQWFADPRDKQILSSMSFLGSQWKKNQMISSVYSHDGSVVQSSEAAAIYGGTIGYFQIGDQSDASTVYQTKLLYLYNPGANAWKETLSYYDDNWAWFGIGLYNNLLPNLAANAKIQ
jgi:endo-1,4-beta-D-glucanase Y